MNKFNKSVGRTIFEIVNFTILTLAAMSCVLPFVNLLSISLSNSTSVSAGEVTFLPVGFDLSAYSFIFQSQKFFNALLISLIRVPIGLIMNVILVVITAYPLSKESKNFKSRPYYAVFFIITMLFQPSLIPSYMVIRKLGLIDSLGALLWPTALPIFSVIVMLNFFRNLPKSLEEAAYIDGAPHHTILFNIFIPISKPSIATIALFSMVSHWNSWFDGLIYMNSPDNYPLQTYLQTIVVSPEAIMRIMAPTKQMADLLQAVNNKTARASQLFVAAIPILAVYPFLQRHFTAGLVLGSVKE